MDDNLFLLPTSYMDIEIGHMMWNSEFMMKYPASIECYFDVNETVDISLAYQFTEYHVYFINKLYLESMSLILTQKQYEYVMYSIQTVTEFGNIFYKICELVRSNNTIDNLMKYDDILKQYYDKCVNPSNISNNPEFIEILEILK